MNIYYDGDCYFCTNFVQLLRLREAVGEVRLISLRSQDPDALRVLKSGLPVNAGFVVEHDGNVYFGSEAYDYLGSLTEPRNLLSRIVLLLRRLGTNSRFVYPILVFGRYLVLILQGGALIDSRPRSEVPTNTFGTRAVRLCVLALSMVGFGRLGLHADGAFPLSTGYFISTIALTAISGTLWIRMFLRQPLAERIFRRIRYADKAIVILYALGWLLATNMIDIIVLRRTVAYICIWPLLGVAASLYQRYAGTSGAGRIPAAVPFALLIFVFFPGLYIAPFYGGIAGWTLELSERSPISISGYKLVNKDGDEIWYNHAFFQPITQNGRLERAFFSAYSRNDEFVKFMLTNYAAIYPMLEQGRMPHQWALGRLAYPAHNLADSNALDYVGRFAPDRIIAVRMVTDTYSPDDHFVKETVIATYPNDKTLK